MPLFLLLLLQLLSLTSAAAKEAALEEFDSALDNDADDSLCPRNREEAAERGRQCLRKCRSDANCISNKKRCLCDGLCGWSCVRPDLNCDELLPITAGYFQVSGDYFGARVTYSCNDGFFMSGSRERVCQGDGTWSDQAPSCSKHAVCAFPKSLPHARHNAPDASADFPIDSLVEYECFVGYEAKGFPKAKCLYYNGTAQWFGPDLKCVPRACSKAEGVVNGFTEGDSHVFTSKVTYHCNEGFQLVGLAHRYCQSNGAWSAPPPTCEREFPCSLLATPLYSQAPVPSLFPAALPASVSLPLSTSLPD